MNEICELDQFNLVINWFGLVITTVAIGIIVLSSVEWEAGLYAVSDRLCHRSRQRLEISLPLLQKWRRSLSGALLLNTHFCWGGILE